MDVTEQSNPQIKYMKAVLVPKIVSKFENEKLEDVKIDCTTGLDGFMSALYNITLKTTLNKSTPSTKERSIIVKFMRDDEEFRESSRSYIQFANEICVYDKILPVYDELLKRAKITDVSVEDWVAHCYASKFGYIDGLSNHPSARESVLALENLKTRGYMMGPRVYLYCDQLLLMSKTLGQYHSMSYALRNHNEKQFEYLCKQIIQLPYIEAYKKEAKPNLYAVLHRISFDRFFEYFDRLDQHRIFDRQNPDDVKFLKNVQRLREKYFDHPEKLLEHLRTNIENNEHRCFGVIVHGDYNRNNVMFRYNKNQEQDSENLGKLEDMKMFDFQELRFGSPAIDISFFMYFNTTKIIRDEMWMDILKVYHNEMYKMLEKILNGLNGGSVEADLTEVLEKYSFEKFYAHFSRFALFGVMICVQYLPWILCSEEECSRLSHYFEYDMHSNEFYKISMSAGGDDVNKCLLDVVRHASKMGYMDFI